MSSPFDRSTVKTLFRGGGALLRLIHRFNTEPAADAHVSWFEPRVPPEILNVLRRRRRGSARLSLLLLQEHGLDQDFCYDFNTQPWRFALLPAEVLHQLTLYYGLALQHRRIAGILDKRALESVKRSIGSHAYAFAVKRAPLIIGHGRGMDWPWDGRGDFGAVAHAAGAAGFLAHFRAAPRAVSSRLVFKFSRPLAGAAVRGAVASQDWPLFKRILIHEIDPRWQTLFS